MCKTKLQQLRMSKCENKLFSCSVHKIAEKADELNELFKDGWLTEETQVVGDTYLVLLKKEHSGRKVFYVDVGNMAPEEVTAYMDRVKELTSNPDKDSDFYIPGR